MYKIGNSGLKNVEQFNVEAGKQYFLGASDDPKLITVTQVTDKFISYTHRNKELKVETWIGMDLIATAHRTVKKQIEQMRAEADKYPFVLARIEWQERVLAGENA